MEQNSNVNIFEGQQPYTALNDVPPVQQQILYQEPAYYGAIPPVQPPKKKKKFPVALICVLLILVLCIVNVFLIVHFLKVRKNGGGKNDGPEKSTFTQLSVTTDENGDFSLLSGSFDDKISSEAEAMDFIARHSSEIGLSNAADELSFLEKTSYKDITYYKYKQVLNGVPVYGNELILTVSPAGEVVALNGRYTPVRISTEAAKTQEEAESAAKEYAGEGAVVLSSELTVLARPESGDARLAYDVKVNGAEKYSGLLIDADSCEIITDNSLYSMAFETVNVNVDGTVHSVDLETQSLGGYRFNDPKRNIIVSDGSMATAASIIITEWIPGSYVAGGFNPIDAVVSHTYDDGSVILRPISWSTMNVSSDLTDYSVISLAAVENAYDLYERLGWRSLDGNDMPIRIIVKPSDSFASVDTSGWDLSESDRKFIDGFRTTLGNLIPIPGTYVGAGFLEKSNVIIVGALDDKPCAGNGTLGHEYTHGVICYKAGLNDSVGSKTINEGYADTIGSIAANDWEFMPHEFRNERFSSVYRSAIDPNKYNGPSEVGGEYFVPFTYTDESGNTCYANEHDNATIVSHAAYLMSLKGLTNDEIAELFFNSMNNLVTGTDFRQAAISLIISADSLSFSQEKKAAVREALYETKMYTPQGKTHIYVHCGSRAIRNSTVTINGNIVGKTDRHGKLVLDFDMKWFGDVKIRAKAKGYDSLAKNVSLVGQNIELDFDLSRTDPDRKVEGQVKVTILDMTEPDNMDKAQVFYVSKGEPIDLEELVDQLGMFGVSTDGIKLYFANKYTPIELSYRIHGTKETFDFSEPLYEDVTIEPMIGIGEDSFNFQDLQEFKEAFEGIFATEAATDASE